MDSKIKEEITIRLTLNRFEAEWLKSLMQNPIGLSDTNPHEEENEQDHMMREAFWNALKKAGI